MGSRPVTILDHAKKQVVEAELLDGLVPEDLMLIEEDWRPKRIELLRQLLRANIANERRPQSLNWNWRSKSHHLQFQGTTGYAIVYDERWQGAMLCKSDSHLSRLSQRQEEPLIYVEFLEVAPWNWAVSVVEQSPEYGRIGRQLFAAAVRQSFDAGYNGRVGLHALPQSCSFYGDVCGMISLGQDDDADELEYFELHPHQARFITNRSS